MSVTLSFDEERHGKVRPLSTDAEGQGCGVRHEDDIRIADLATSIGIDEGLLSIQDLMHDLTASLISTANIVEDSTVDGGRDTDLLGAVSPMLDTMTSTKAFPLADVVYVDVPAVSDLDLGEAVKCRIASAEELIPKEDVRGDLRVIPGVTADVISPCVPVAIVRLVEVAVIPEAVVSSTLSFAFVVLH